jgi:hypothetical protein
MATMVKRFNGSTSLFAVVMRDQATTATVRLTCVVPNSSAEVLGDGRSVQLAGDRLSDCSVGYGVHLNRVD